MKLAIVLGIVSAIGCGVDSAPAPAAISAEVSMPEAGICNNHGWKSCSMIFDDCGAICSTFSYCGECRWVVRGSKGFWVGPNELSSECNQIGPPPLGTSQYRHWCMEGPILLQ